MHSIKIKYSLFRRRWMPIIPLKLFSQSSLVDTHGYLDSGAFYSIFEIRLLQDLGLPPTLSKKRLVVTGTGSFMPIYVYKLPVELLGHKFTAQIGFSDRLGVGFNLIGRKGIFENFEEIIFREEKREIEFKY